MITLNLDERVHLASTPRNSLESHTNQECDSTNNSVPKGLIVTDENGFPMTKIESSELVFDDDSREEAEYISKNEKGTLMENDTNT
eukprot:UN00421